MAPSAIDTPAQQASKELPPTSKLPTTRKIVIFSGKLKMLVNVLSTLF